MKHIEELITEARCDSFDHDHYGDYDAMYADAPGAGPRCGGPRYEYGREFGCPGCRHCCPPDHESKPYGFGIERFEDPALVSANADVANRWFGGPYQNLHSVGTFLPRSLNGRGACYAGNLRRHELRDEIWATASRQSLRRYRRSEIVWDRLCDSCETHAEAKAAYEQWAKRAVTVRYRDED